MQLDCFHQALTGEYGHGCQQCVLCVVHLHIAQVPAELEQRRRGEAQPSSVVLRLCWQEDC